MQDKPLSQNVGQGKSLLENNGLQYTVHIICKTHFLTSRQSWVASENRAIAKNGELLTAINPNGTCRPASVFARLHISTCLQGRAVDSGAVTQKSHRFKSFTRSYTREHCAINVSHRWVSTNGSIPQLTGIIVCTDTRRLAKALPTGCHLNVC